MQARHLSGKPTRHFEPGFQSAAAVGSIIVDKNENAFDRHRPRLVQTSHFPQTNISGASATTAWIEEAGPDGVVVSERARVSDLVVLSHAIENQTDSAREILDATIFDSGAPVLLVPARDHKAPGLRIGIGWNKGTLASRAVRNAMPFLELADEIVIFQIETGAKSGPSAEDLAVFLALHEVTASVRRLIPDRLSVAERLLTEAANAELDMLVMGAYSHSRLAQMVLGGVTHDILSRAELPILMSH